MNALQQFMESVVVQQCGWVLVHSVWQLSFVVMVYLALRRLLQNFSPAVRYLASCTAMVAMATAPLLTVWIINWQAVDAAPAGSSRKVAVAAVESRPELPSPVAPPARLSKSAESAAPQAAEPTTFEAAPALVTDTWGHWLAASITPVLPWVVAIWVLGVVVLAVQQLGGWLVLRRLCRIETQPVDGPLLEQFQQLAQRLNVGRPVRLLRSLRVDVPSVVGHFKPIVLLPASMTSGLAPHELEAILAHELAHIRRHDYLVNFLQSLIEILLFYHPAVWWLSREIRIEREYCCDDLAVSVCRDRVAYASALAALAELRESVRAPQLAANGGLLLARIRRLLNQSPASHAQRDVCFAVALVLALLTSLLFLSPGAISLARVSEGLAGQDSSLKLLGRRVGSFTDSLLQADRALAYLGEPAFRHRRGATRLAFLPDGQRLVTISNYQGEREVQLWDVATGRRLRRFALPDQRLSGPTCLAVSPNGNLIAVGRGKGFLSVWDASTGRLQFHDQVGERTVHSMVFSPDGENLITGNQTDNGDGIVQLVSVYDFTQRRQLVVPGQRDRRTGARTAFLSAIAVSPDGKRLAVAECAAGAIFLFDVVSGELLVNIESAHGPGLSLAYSCIKKLAFTDDGRNLVSTGYRLTARDKTSIESGAKNVQLMQVRLWDVATGELSEELIGKDVGGEGVSAFAPDGSSFVTADGDALRLWRMGEPQPRKTVSMMRGYRGAMDLAYSPDGSTFAVPTSRGITFWDAVTGQRRWHDQQPRYTDLRSVAWSDQGDQLAVGYSDGLELWDAATGQLEHSLAMGTSGESYRFTPGANHVAFSADGRWLVAAGKLLFPTWPGHFGNVRVWDTASGAELRSIRVDRPVWSMALADDASVVAVTTGHGNSKDSQLCVYELATGRLLSRYPDDVENLPETRVRGFDRVKAIRIVPGSTRVLLACEDNRCFQWDYVSQEEVSRFFADERTDRRACKIRSAVFSPSGKSLVTSGPGKVCLWNTESETLEQMEVVPTGKNYLNLGMSRDGRRLAGADLGYPELRTTHAIWIWDLPGLTLRLTLAPPGARATHFAFSPDNTRLLTGLGRGTAMIWDIR